MNFFIMHYKKLLIILLLSFSSSVLAEEIVLPFGIRNYDKGIAPNFILQDIDGETFELKKTRGHWVFLHFWASWCGPCQEEMPAVQKLANIMEKDLQIVMINTAEDEDTVFEFLASTNIDLNSLIDKDGQVTEVWKPRGLPTTFLISPAGEIKYQAIGGREWNKPEYVSFIKQLTISSFSTQSQK